MKRRPAAKPSRMPPAPMTATAGHPLLDEVEGNHDFMLMMLDVPISFHRAYVPMTGMVTAALLLSYAVQLCMDGDTHYGITDREGWFTRTQQQWTDQIGLSKDELATARARLRELGVLEERLVRDEGGFRSALQYRANFERIQELLLEQATRLRRERCATTAH